MPDLVKRGLFYRPNGDQGAEEKYAAPGTLADDLPPHGMGRCGADCAMEGEHDWFLRDGVAEPGPEPAPRKRGGK